MASWEGQTTEIEELPGSGEGGMDRWEEDFEGSEILYVVLW